MNKDLSSIEEGKSLELDFSKLKKVARCGDFIPAIAQDVDSGEVLIVGYINEEALKTTIEEQVAVFWSTSRNELWIKGKTSGDFLDIVDVRVNCEQNSVLYRVKLRGDGACHTSKKNGAKRLSCFYRAISEDGLVKIDE
jgi:phosphoribosyl-AMP cyclohydrolase